MVTYADLASMLNGMKTLNADIYSNLGDTPRGRECNRRKTIAEIFIEETKGREGELEARTVRLGLTRRQIAEKLSQRGVRNGNSPYDAKTLKRDIKHFTDRTGVLYRFSVE